MDLMPFLRDSLKFSQQRALFGNGMHLAQCGAVLTYILANVARVEDIAKYFCPPRLLSGKEKWDALKPGNSQIDLSDSEDG
eukprot:14703070-Alexandrium_andersonii.AAC.1